MRSVLSTVAQATLFVCFLSSTPAFAQESCGNFLHQTESETITVPIENCDNPFGIVNENTNLTVTFNETIIEPGGTYEFLNSKNTFSISGEHPDAIFLSTELYKHVENDYLQIEPDTNSRFLFAEEGTYTVVLFEDGEFIQTNNWRNRIFDFLFPKAYAFPGASRAVTFTVTDTTEELNGSPSILFLPGIMGSRLYEESEVCGSSVKERERWVSSSECDQFQLMTNVAGQSINDIYTKNGEESIVDASYSLNLYKSFLASLAEWKTEGVIADYATVPYDWRLRLDDLLKAQLDSETGKITYNVSGTLTDGYLYQTLATLVASSSSGKITIVAHSNGGLLAKVFLEALPHNNDPLLDKIDNLILVAVPQVGTPDAIIGMLHGTEIGPGGVVLSQEMTRRLMSTMPFAYHLLPNQQYFTGQGSGITTPVITFEDGDQTTPWKNTFGATVTSEQSLYNFLRKESGRSVPSDDDLLSPAVVDGFLFQYADLVTELLKTWVAPSTMNVYQIAGVGVETPAGITYFTDRECVSRNPLKLFTCTEYKSKLGIRVNHSEEGDGTVVMPSALAMSTDAGNVKRLWIDLQAQDEEEFGREHKDIFEVNDVLNFVQNTIHASSSLGYTYLSDAEPQLSEENRLAYYLHSPLDMFVTTEEGVVSSTTNTIRGATYRRYGELQYISVPKNNGSPHNLVLNGYKTGSFTLEVEAWEDNHMSVRNEYSGIPSGTSTNVHMTIQGDIPIKEALLEVDYDGDGNRDIAFDTAGEVSTVITYDTLIQAIQGLSLKSAFKKPLIATVHIAEKYNQKSLRRSVYKKLEITALQILKKQLMLYNRKRLVSNDETENVVTIIDGLIKK